MELDLHGLFELNNSYDYDDYSYSGYLEEDSQSSRVCSFLTAFIPLLCCVVMLLGLVGNGVVLAVLWHKRRNLSVMDIFVLYLGAADVLLLLTLPLWAVDAVKGWTLGTGLCKLTGALFKINLYCGIFLLALISLISYLSVIHGTQIFSSTVIHLSCVAICFICLLLSTPDWIYLKRIIDPTDPHKAQCDHVYSNHHLQVATRLLHLVVGVFLPALLVLCCCILWHIHKSPAPQKKKDITTHVYAVLVLAYFVSWTPYNITFIVDTVSITDSMWCKGKLWTASNLTAVVALLHCVVKPVIYVCLSKKFRRRALTMVKLRGCEAQSKGVSLWDCDEVSGRPCVLQEKQSSLHPVNDIKQTTITQNHDI